MNEVFRRRLIGLAVLLALVFALSLLLPQDGPVTAKGEGSSTTVSLIDGETVPAVPASKPEPLAQAEPERRAPPEAEPAVAISDLREAAVAPPPLAVPPAAPTPAVPKQPIAALKLSPTVAASLPKPAPVERKPVKPVAASPPVPAAKRAAAVVAKAEPAPGLSPPKPKLAESVAKPAPAAASAVASGWYVQIGSFAERGKAETILSLVQTLGYKGEISKISNSAGTPLHRVRLGPFASEGSAKQAQERIARQGYPQSRVVNESGH